MKSLEDIFPNCPICNRKIKYEITGFFTKYAKCYRCKSKWKIITKKGKITELMLHELPKDGKATFTIIAPSDGKEPLYDLLGECHSVSYWKKLRLDEKINWNWLLRSINYRVTKKIIFDKGEKLLTQWIGRRYFTIERTINGTSSRFNVNESGILLLSNKKFYWIQQKEVGFLNKSIEDKLIFEIPLEKIRSIIGGTGTSEDWSSAEYATFRTKFSIIDNESEKKFSLHLAFIETFKPIVEKAIEMRNNEIEKEKKKERLHFILDFSFLKKQMENGGIVMKLLKCPNCNGKIAFPETGSQTQCEYCGNRIYAQDVFEKVKSLLE